jgi:hypothetical protein
MEVILIGRHSGFGDVRMLAKSATCMPSHLKVQKAWRHLHIRKSMLYPPVREHAKASVGRNSKLI